ncbi:MAG: TolB family protein [Gemmatimonadota bacterium]
MLERVERRRARRASTRKAEVGLLAFAVIAATTAGFLALRQAFGDGERSTGGVRQSLVANGEIVFSAGGDDGYVHLYAMQPDGSGLRQITDFGTDDTAPAVSPDGATIAFVHQLEEAPPAIATIPVDGGDVTWLTDADFFVTDGPTWSPDGTRIAFAATHGDGQRIFVMDADGRDPQPITGDGVYWPEGPAWSPDGTTIAFAASPISGDEEPSVWDIYTIGADGTGLVNVTDSPMRTSDESAPTWSPGGGRLAFSRSTTEEQAIVIRTLGSGEETAVTGGSFVDGSPAWSPDGRWIAFDRAGFDREPGQHPAREEIWRVRADGTGAEQLTTERGFDPAWQPIPSVGVSPEASGTGEPSPEPEPSPSVEPNRDTLEVGLPYRLCDATRLDGIDWLGDGTRGIAWVGSPARENGTCPQGDGGLGVVAADIHGDGIADAASGSIKWCFFCRAYDTTDLDDDGKEELVVLYSAGSTPSFMIYAVDRTAAQMIAPLLVAEPGHPAARIMPGAPLTFSTGGDEGFAGWVGCDARGVELILEIRWRDHPTEGHTQEVHETGLVLRDGMFHVVNRNDYSLPAESPVPGAGNEPACGVDWQP